MALEMTPIERIGRSFDSVEPLPDAGEQVELRWVRPDHSEAVVFTRWYATASEAVAALDAAIEAMKGDG